MTASEIAAALEAAGFPQIPFELAARFQDYLELLLKWNARLNLTAIRSPEEIVLRHFVECIFAARHLPPGIRSLLDFGSGGGFPGIPIALCRPETHVTLGESQSKKAAFLREALRNLGVSNATVYNGRIEELGQAFDAVTLRAVDKMQEASRVALRNVAPGGHLVLFLTEEAIARVQSEFPQIEWHAPLLLPASTQRIVLIGRLTPSVPRGT